MSLLTRCRKPALSVLGVGFVGFVILQFIRPHLPNPPVTDDLEAPPAVKQILTTSCYNCHSNETKLPWYDEVVPAYWLVVRDVKRGRMHLNFSSFGGLGSAAQKSFLYESVSDMQTGYMPPRNYLLVHPGAKVTEAQLKTLKDWLDSRNGTPLSNPQQVAANEADFTKWQAGALHKNHVAPALNGLAFPADYADWKPLSFTDRFDNHTLRIILGNDIAQKAVADQQTHPWPDGAAFAKIAIAQGDDGHGAVSAGAFEQVEFMVKDRAKYASTDGWGFGRWKTTDLVPYGRTRLFANECVSCHAPMKDNDHVFTMPIRGGAASEEVFNGLAALPGDLPVQPMGWRVITMSLDRTQRTMSTLFGNDLAITHTRTDAQSPWPVGAQVALVTWKAQEDKHWFGGRIPGAPETVEVVTVAAPATPDAPVGFVYESYAGTPLVKQTGNAAATAPRAFSIMGMKAAVLP